MNRTIQLFFIIIGGSLGFTYIPRLIHALNYANKMKWLDSPYTGLAVGAFIFFLLTFWFVDSLVQIIELFEEKIIKAPVTVVLFGTLGLIFGLIIAFLIQIPLDHIKLKAVNTVLPLFIYLFLGYFGFKILYKKRDEVMSLLSYRDKEKKRDPDDPAKNTDKSLKILDTSVIIDRRIANICQTGFLEGTLGIPQFILQELQHIADSSDDLKRTRGRRGLDILNKIQKELAINVEILEEDFEEITEVDNKLVKLTKLFSGIVVTNDFNLNKVCELQGVSVLNINDLAYAVKPIVLPGEELKVGVIEDGKERHQGVGFLDDGTMIVVEDGREYIGKTIDVIVTRILQNSAGQMIFAKPKLLEKVL